MTAPLTLLCHPQGEFIQHALFGDGLHDLVPSRSPAPLSEIENTIGRLYTAVNNHAFADGAASAPNVWDQRLENELRQVGATLAEQLFTEPMRRILRNALLTPQTGSASHGVFAVSGRLAMGIPWETIFLLDPETLQGEFLSDRAVVCRLPSDPQEESMGRTRRLRNSRLRIARLRDSALDTHLTGFEFTGVGSLDEIPRIVGGADVVVVCSTATEDASGLLLPADGSKYDRHSVGGFPLGMACINILFSCGSSAPTGTNPRNLLASALSSRCGNTVIYCTSLFPSRLVRSYTENMLSALTAHSSLEQAVAAWYHKCGPMKRLFHMLGEWDWELANATSQDIKNDDKID